MMPYVSIIVPIYNVERYLCECLDSILAWDFQEWEAILVDDGSPDRSGAICDSYAARDERFLVIHKENGGVSSARNAALDVARGTWVWFVDSDDVIDPHTPVDKTLLAGHDFVMFDDVVKFRDGEPVPYGAYCVGTPNVAIGGKRQIFENNLVSFHQSLWYHSDWWKTIRFSLDMKYGEDQEFMRKCEILCQRPVRIYRVNYYYRQREGSVMNIGAAKNPRMVQDILLLSEHLLAFMREHNVQPEPWIERRIEGHLKVIAVHAARGRAFDSKTQKALRNSVKAYHRAGFNVFRRIDYRVAIWSLRVYAMAFNLKERLQQSFKS